VNERKRYVDASINVAFTSGNRPGDTRSRVWRKSLQGKGERPAMLNRILVPLDGSELAERALVYADFVARPASAKVLLVRAAMSHTLAGVDGQERRVGAIHEAEEYLAQVKADLTDRGLEVETVVPYGPAAECIADRARLHPTDLIVMSTHGRTGPAHLLFGSVAESVVSRTSVPVMLERAWHPMVRAPRLGPGMSLTLLLDGSPFAEAGVDAATRLALNLGVRLDLVRVIVDPGEVDATGAYLETIREHIAATHPAVQIATTVRFGDNASDEIAHLLAETRPVVVVMATHGRTGLRRSFVGSVAGHVLRHATAPLVLVRPTLPEEQSESAVPFERAMPVN
jgi:nucleotide-binding universal stress UspA family protein